MPWLRGGTVAVTNGSTTVVGTNADFAANSRIGDAFVGPDGINYEIGNVASATVISVIPAYKGPTASGVAYAIMPVQGYPKALADAFNNINLQWGPKLAALGTTGNYEVLPANKGGTGIADLSVFIQTLLNDPDAAAGRVTLGAARSGPNNDITSLTGLTTALSVALGGTGVATIAALLSALQSVGAYAKGNILGTVAQTAGVPTGAIIERGSNSNGSYVKYADGSLICWVSNTVAPLAVNLQVNAYMYVSTVSAFSFPAVFTQFPAITPIAVSPTGGYIWPVLDGLASTSGFSMRIMSANNTTNGYAGYLAIGRWF